MTTIALNLEHPSVNVITSMPVGSKLPCSGDNQSWPWQPRDLWSGRSRTFCKCLWSNLWTALLCLPGYRKRTQKQVQTIIRCEYPTVFYINEPVYYPIAQICYWIVYCSTVRWPHFFCRKIYLIKIAIEMDAIWCSFRARFVLAAFCQFLLIIHIGSCIAMLTTEGKVRNNLTNMPIQDPISLFLSMLTSNGSSGS